MCRMRFWGVTVGHPAAVLIDHLVPLKEAWGQCVADGVLGCGLTAESLTVHENARVWWPEVMACSAFGATRRRANP